MLKRLCIFAIFCCLPISTLAIASGSVASSPDGICPILIGTQLPDITLKDLSGESFDLNKAVATKPTVLIYFRGGW